MPDDADARLNRADVFFAEGVYKKVTNKGQTNKQEKIYKGKENTQAAVKKRQPKRMLKMGTGMGTAMDGLGSIDFSALVSSAQQPIKTVERQSGKKTKQPITKSFQ